MSKKEILIMEILLVNPFSTMTHLPINSSNFLTILYSFRDSCGDYNSTDLGH